MMMLGSNEKNFHSTIFFSGQRRNENNKVRDLIEFWKTNKKNIFFFLPNRT